MPERETYTIEVKVDDTKARMVIDRLNASLSRLRQLGDFSVGAAGPGGAGVATTAGVTTGRAPTGPAAGPATSVGAAGGGIGATERVRRQQEQMVRTARERGLAGLGGIGAMGGLAGGFATEAAMPFTFAGARAAVSGMAQVAQFGGALSGHPAGMAAGAAVGIIGNIMNAMFQHRQMAMGAAMQQMGGVAAYNRSLGFARAGGAGGMPMLGAKTFDRAVRQGARARVLARFKREGKSPPPESVMNVLIDTEVAGSDRMELAMEGKAGAGAAPEGFAPQEAARILQQYSAGIGYQPPRGRHETPFAYMMATAGPQAMARFAGLRAAGAGGFGRFQGRDQPSVLQDILAQAVSQGLRFSKVDEYLNTISGSVEALGRVGLDVNLANMADFTRAIAFQNVDPTTRGLGPQDFPGLRAARVAAGFTGAIGQARGMVFGGLRQALPSFALAAAAQRGGGLFDIAAGFEDLAADPAQLMASLPPELQSLFVLAMGGTTAMAGQGERPFERPFGPMRIPRRVMAPARAGAQAAREAARTQALTMTAGAGMQTQLQQEQLDKLSGLLETAMGHLEWSRSKDNPLNQLMPFLMEEQKRQETVYKRLMR